MEPVINEGKTIMFVEDDRDVIKIVEAYAKQKTHSHTFFMVKLGGRAALNYLERWEYESVDAVVLDLKMPDMGGLKLTQRIREGEKKHRPGCKPIKIFWYTGLQFDEGDKYDPYTLVMNERKVEKVFTKPYAVTDVIEEVLVSLENDS